MLLQITVSSKAASNNSRMPGLADGGQVKKWLHCLWHGHQWKLDSVWDISYWGRPVGNDRYYVCAYCNASKTERVP